MENSSCSTGITEAEGEEQDETSSSSNKQSVAAEDELAAFRARWQQEIKSQPKEKTQKVKNINNLDFQEDTEEDIAKALFIKGIELEQAGKLYEAIQFYKKAVQLVPDVEFKLDYRPKGAFNETKENFDEIHETEESSSSDEDEVIEDGQLLSRVQKKVSRCSALCFAKFEQSTTHISNLPPEIILYILKWVVSADLDLKSLEMFGSVCRGFYLCARDPEIWHLVCLRIWGLNTGPSPDNYLSWRNMFLDRPRLNYNGCYISKISYIRHGENSFQDQFYRPWHLVTYYRYLRFFPEGIVVMLTSSDEPSTCVGQLKTRTPRGPAMAMTGYYRLKDDTVTLVVQRPKEAPKALQSGYRRNNRKKEVDSSEQTFHMEMKIQSHRNRKHVKLVWTYYSVFTRNKTGHESTTEFDLISTRFPPLLFSRVKSYTLESDQPLN